MLVQENTSTTCSRIRKTRHRYGNSYSSRDFSTSERWTHTNDSYQCIQSRLVLSMKLCTGLLTQFALSFTGHRYIISRCRHCILYTMVVVLVFTDSLQQSTQRRPASGFLGRISKCVSDVHDVSFVTYNTEACLIPNDPLRQL